MAEPTLGELVKMQEEVGATKRLRRYMGKSSEACVNQKPSSPLNNYPPFKQSSSSDVPREEPATLKKWKQKYGSRYQFAMQQQKPSSMEPVRKVKRRDPRFDPRCGEYVPEVFRANYSFVKDMRENEVGAMKKEITKLSRKISKPSNGQEGEIPKGELLAKQRKLKQLMKSSQNRIVSEQHRVEQYRLINDVKRKEALESAKEGRHPHFMNKAELRQLKLAAQYRQLKESGDLDKYLDRKRRKAAQGVRRFRPE